MKTLIKPIPLEKQGHGGWIIEINGKKIPNVQILKISNPEFGQLTYGLTPGGWNGWSFHEIGGGGAIIIPFAKIDGELLVGLVFQNRPNQGGYVWNVPRGFLNPGEKHFQSAVRELEEELELMSPEKRMKKLPGEKVNPNSAFVETPDSEEGGRFYAIEFLKEHLIKDNERYKIDPQLLTPKTKQAELIMKSQFFSWREAVLVGDLFTRGILASLLSVELVR